MSFSTDVKYELLLMEENNIHCKIAKLSAFINVIGGVTSDCIIIHNDNITILEKVATLIYDIFGAEVQTIGNDIVIMDNNLIERILSTTGVRLDDDISTESLVKPSVISSVCCKRAYLRGAFASCGSISDPNKQYHIEFSSSDYDCIHLLQNIILSFGIEAKIIERKSYFVLYLKEAEQIVDILNIMSAHKALLQLENLRIVKDMRNRVNRIVNCETANLNKVVLAAVKQIESINYIVQNRGLDYLEEPLIQVAKLRLANPEASLKELSELSNPKIGKSGINHRLKKICEIADNLKGEL